MFALPITQHVKVVKDGQDIPQAYGGSYLLNRATSFIAGEAGREVAAFFPLSDPSRSRAIFAQLQTQLGGILGTGSAPTRMATPTAAVPMAAGGGALSIQCDVVLPGGTTLVGEARSVGHMLAPYVAEALGIQTKQRRRRH